MKVHAEYFEPECIKDRKPYRLRIEGKNGEAIEVVEQMGGGFLVSVVAPLLSARMEIQPISGNAIIVKAGK